MNTPKEKAEELIDTYFNIEYKFNLDLFCDECGIDKAAKYCALIAVDQILSEYWSHNTERRNWWKQVKQEIEKL